MVQNTNCPQRPVRATFVTFVILAAFVGAVIPFDERMRGAWPIAFGYCALLAVAAIGLAHFSGRALLLLLGVPAAIALAPAVVGIALIFRSGGSLDSGRAWLHVSLYLFYALGGWSIFLVIRGWLQYFAK